MTRVAIFSLFAFPAIVVTDGHLPAPDYHRQRGDPAWLIAGMEEKEVAGVSEEQSIPYFKLPFSVDAIAEIHLGPKNRARENRTGLEVFLRTHGYDCSRIRVVPSQVPYR